MQSLGEAAPLRLWWHDTNAGDVKPRAESHM
jgi:hypothetical protein